jgi:proteic killer suppression protein
VIQSFNHKGLQRFYDQGSLKGIIAAHARRLEYILSALDAADQPSRLNFADLHLHSLKGNRSGNWAVTVRANWRVTFRFDASGNAVDVDYEDYH